MKTFDAFGTKYKKSLLEVVLQRYNSKYNVTWDFISNIPNFKDVAHCISSHPNVPITFIFDTLKTYEWDYNDLMCHPDMTFNLFMAHWDVFSPYFFSQKNLKSLFPKTMLSRPFVTTLFIKLILKFVNKYTDKRCTYNILADISSNKSIPLEFFIHHRESFTQEWFDCKYSRLPSCIKSCSDITTLSNSGIDVTACVGNNFETINDFEDFSLQFVYEFSKPAWNMENVDYDDETLTVQYIINNPHFEWNWNVLSHKTFGELDNIKKRCGKNIWKKGWVPYWDNPKFAGQGKGYDKILRKKACVKKIWYQAWLPYWYNPKFAGQGKGCDKDMKKWMDDVKKEKRKNEEICVSEKIQRT